MYLGSGSLRLPVNLEWPAILSEPGLPAVAIAAPAAQHHALAREALRAGKHVFADIPQMTYETAVIPKAVKPHYTIRHGLLGTVKTDRLIGDRKRTPTTISHCEGALRPAQHTAVLSGDLDATGWAAVMAAKEPAGAHR